MKKLVIEKSALKKNLAVIKAAAGRSCIYANLSRDAYGAGAVEMAKLLREEGISHFAVDDVDVAVALRRAGLVEEEILMLRSMSDRKELEKLLDHNIVFSIGNLETGVALNALPPNAPPSQKHTFKLIAVWDSAVSPLRSRTKLQRSTAIWAA